MFSYEDRLRAVRLYIKLGKRVGLTIRQLGYPTKNALESWHREYGRSHDLPAGYSRGPRYSQAQKGEAVRHYLDQGRCLAATIKALRYPSRDLLRDWVQTLHPDIGARIVGRVQALTAAEKQAAVIALCMRQTSAQSVAQELRVSRPSLYDWKNQLLGDDAPASMTRQQDSPPSSERTALEQQLEALRRDDKYAKTRRAMTEIFERNYRCYGYRRMQASLTRQSLNISAKVVRRLMKQECLVAVTRKRRRYGSYMGEISPAPESLLDRNFSASAPNEKWLTDITEFQIPAGKVYLSPMIDCFDGMVVSWSIGTRPGRRPRQYDAGCRHRDGHRRQQSACGAF